MSITPIAPIMPLGIMTPVTPTDTGSQSVVGSGDGTAKVAGDFSKFLNDALGQVDALQTNADTVSAQLATGQITDMSTVMVALQKANLALSLTVATRDKVLDAYNQVMRMQM